ncbi:MAG: LacI family transcriptional regulator [Anaerolineae bacterium]|nr:MAG: LacI family transcriptional regulator [Anaerolineae bacterium]WKZ43222.1 MAG: LacI family DNA-binding transcriptional regulator [Anaerolineales bacterium]
MTVTIKDIAKEAGVSHTTVSRALRGSSLISDETTRRIQETALTLGYLPSAAARSLKTNRSQALGIIVSSIDDPYFSEILQGIEEIAQANHYSLFIAASQRDAERESVIVQAMRQHRVDGIIICSTPFSAERSQQFSKYDIPIVMINNQAAEEYRYSIYHDDMDGSRQIARHLIELGHRRIAYLGNSSSGRTTQDRLAGFHYELQASGLPLPNEYIYETPGSEPNKGELAVDHFLQLANRPTAIVCFNDMLAIGVLKSLQQRGFRVPEDISITGFDNIVFSNYTNPPLTTFDQPKRFIGQRAAELILSLLSSASDIQIPQQKIQVLRGSLLVRSSSAPPSASF